MSRHISIAVSLLFVAVLISGCEKTNSNAPDEPKPPESHPGPMRTDSPDAGEPVSMRSVSRAKRPAGDKPGGKTAPRPAVAKDRSDAKRSGANGGHKYALLVGCTKYDGAPPLQGPVNDVRVMSELLARRFQFPEANVRKLVGWPDAAGDRPTYANIAAEFKKLIDLAKPNSQIVILLSGHGSQVPVPAGQKSLLDPANREPDGMDEVFLPSDFKNWDRGTVRNSLSDNQLSDWLNQMSDKGASVWLICDCCHSGTLSKSGGGPPADVRWRRADPAKHLGIPAEVMAAAERRIGEGGASKSPSLEASPVQVHRAGKSSKGKVIAFYAAQPFEEAPEMPRPRGAENQNGSAVHGMLTYSVARVLEQNSHPMTYRELSQKVLSLYRSENLSFLPTPSADGDVDQEVLGLRSWPGRSDFLLERHSGKTFVTGGELHGLNTGTILRVRPPAGSGADATILGYVKITAPRVTLAEVAPCPFTENGKSYAAVDLGKLPDLARCEVVFRAAGGTPLKLALAAGAKAGPSLAAILNSMPAESRGFVKASDAKNADWLLRATENGYDLVQVRGSANDDAHNRVVHTYPAGDVKNLAESLANDLRRISIWSSVWKVAEAGSIGGRPGRKKPRFKFEVRRLDANGKPRPGGAQSSSVVHPGDVLEIVLDNRRGFENVWVTVLFLDARYGIDVFLSESVGEGKSLKPIQIEITDETFGPEGLIVLVQNLKEFGQRQRFEFLAQKPLGTRGKSKGAANPQTPFEKLLAAAHGDKGQNAKGFELGHPANPIVFTYSWITRARGR